MNDVALGVILGIVEGVSEYLPISSTGHLLITGQFLGFTGERAETFEIFIQLGAILAVVFLYSERFLGILRGLRTYRQHTFNGPEGVIKLGLGTIPILVFGFLFHHFIKEQLFSTSVVAFSLILGGIVLLLFPDRDNQSTTTLDEISYKQSFGIGLFQLLALCPGVSRSGATIIGGLILGCRRTVAAEFSFLLAVPAMCAAVGYDLFKSLKYLSPSDVPLFATGFVVSFVVAVFTVRAFVAFLTKTKLFPFGIYRIIFGLLVLWYFA